MSPEQIRSGKCLAGGVTVRLDEKHFVARLRHAIVELRQPVSFKLLAGSFIFCDAAVFRKSAASAMNCSWRRNWS
jgi:hypothetical protein